MTSVGDSLSAAAAALASAGVENARTEARLILAAVAESAPAEIFNAVDQDIDDGLRHRFEDAVDRRAAGTPFAHIAGEREFWSLPFRVSPATLVPRPDTETLIALALALFKDRTAPGLLADLGTGSGCLALTLLHEFSDAHGVAVDISADALCIARENAIALGLDGRCRFVEGGWREIGAGPFDLMVSNPPYIPRADIDALAAEVRDHEPRSALDGGTDGLDAYREILPLMAERLAATGIAIVEIGVGQAADIGDLAAAGGLRLIEMGRDLAGHERALAFCKKGIGKPKS